MNIWGPENSRVMQLDAEHPAISTVDDVLDIIGATWGEQVDIIAIPADRLDPAFFDLSTRLAGELLQKFVTYGKRVAIVGDISAQVEASSALRDFVWESNRGGHVWFAADSAELERRIVGPTE